MLLSMISVHAQVEYPPDYMDDSPKMFYENKGQIIDNMNNVRNDVKYYTTALSPTEFSGQANVYLFDDGKMSFVQVHGGNDTIPDTLSRVDFQLVGEGLRESAVSAVNQSKDYRNYYLPHCASGATYCYAYEQFNYREVYDNIDFEVRANQAFGKYYFIVHPGGNPSDIEFQFTGQDSANIDPYWIELYYHTDILELPNAIAYEMNSNGTMSPVNWSPAFLNLGNGKIGFQTGSYNTNKDLVIQLAPPMPPMMPPTGGNDNNDWTTFYGSNYNYSGLGNREQFYKSTTDDNNNLCIIGGTNDSNYPILFGTTTTYNGGAGDIVLLKFDDNGNREWASYLGGNNLETGTDIICDNSDNILIVGVSYSSDFPTTDNSLPNYDGVITCTTPPPGFPPNCEDGFIGKFSPNGIVDFITFHTNGQSNSTQAITAIDIDNLGNIYVGGTGNVQIIGQNSTNVGGTFISKYSPSMQLLFSTKFGDGIWFKLEDISVDNNRNIFFGGTYYPSGNLNNFPVIGQNNSSYTESHKTSQEIYLAKIDNQSNQIVWGTFYGGTHDDNLFALKLDLNNDLYVSGRTFSNDFDTKFPLTNESTLDGVSDAIFAKFSNTGTYFFGTYYGGEFDEKAVDIAFDSENAVYFTGYSNSKFFENTTKPFSNYYSQGNSRFDVANDAFIVMLDENHNLKWSTLFGGKGEDIANGMTISSNNKLFLVGNTDSYDYSSFPIEDPGNGAYIDANQNVNGISDRDDSFIARFILTTQMTGTELQNIDDNNLIVYPNPTGSILNIKIRGNNEIEKFNIYNSIGMCVLSCEMTNSDKYLNTSIDVSSLPAGIYNIILKSTEGIISTSFLKQ